MAGPCIQANTDGRLHRANGPSIFPLNRGFLYGDAIYEVWRICSQTICARQENWRRLETYTRARYLKLPLDCKSLLDEISYPAARFCLRLSASQNT